VLDATVIGNEDPGFAGGSYVVVQKYARDRPDNSHVALTRSPTKAVKSARSCETTCRSA